MNPKVLDILRGNYSGAERKQLYPIIVQIGVGGTGSNLSQQLAQMLSLFGQNAYYLLADPDLVEAKNLRNQLFSEKNVGKPKAEILAKRYAAAYGINIHSYTDSYIETLDQLKSLFNTDSIAWPSDSYYLRVLPILIGAVDNNFSRRLFHQFFESVPNLLWLDAGNESTAVPKDFLTRSKEQWTEDEINDYNFSGWTGQVVCSLKINRQVILPSMAERFPEILIDDDEVKPSEVSCQELAASDPQRLLTNRMACMAMSTYLTELFECGTLSNQMTVFHAKKGYMRSEPITEKTPDI